MYDSFDSKSDTKNTKWVGWAKTRIVQSSLGTHYATWPLSFSASNLVPKSLTNIHKRARQNVVLVKPQQVKAVSHVTIRRASGSIGELLSSVTNRRFAEKVYVEHLIAGRNATVKSYPCVFHLTFFWVFFFLASSLASKFAVDLPQ